MYLLFDPKLILSLACDFCYWKVQESIREIRLWIYFIICLSCVLANTEFPHYWEVSQVSHISAQCWQDIRRREERPSKQLMVSKMRGGRRKRRRRAQFDPVIGDLANMSLASHFQEKLKELHIPIPQKGNRRQRPSSECAVPVHGSGEGIHQEAWRQKSFIQPKGILNSSPCWQI